MTATTMSPADRLRRLTGEMLQRDGWSREQLLEHQRERVRELIAHAVEHSPYYRYVLGDGDLESQPTLSKQTLMAEWDHIVCDPRLRRRDVEAHVAGPHAAEPYLGEYEVFSTSGASGLRGLFVYGRQDWAVALASTMRAMTTAGARPVERTIGIGSPPGIHMSQRIYAHLGTSAPGTPQISALTPLDEMVAALNDFQPEVLLGYPSVGALLAAEQLAGRLRIAPHLIAFGSEPVTIEVRERVGAAWGIDPGEYYVSTEAPMIATSRPDRPRVLELYDDLHVVEAVDEDGRPVPDGTPGSKVLITNLHNRALPLIRYELADRITISPDPNPAGRPYRPLAGIDGRTADTLTLPAAGGGTVAVLPLRLGAPFARLPEVRQFQIVHEPARLEVRVVLDPSAGADTPERVRMAVTRALLEVGAVPPAVSVTSVDRLEREAGPAAKLKLIVSRT
jgi:phenylacetate-coenzyme A ligase PaaK-like adenylate-forming protein